VRLFWIVVFFVSIPSGAWGDSLRLAVNLAAKGEQIPSRGVTLRVFDTSRLSTEQRIEVQVPGSVEVDVEPGKLWRFEIEDESLWSPGTTIFASPQLKSVSVDLHPSSTLSGKLEVQKKKKKPEELKIRFMSSAAEGLIAENTESCRFTEESRFLCRIPAGKMNLRLRATGFVSKYFWDVTMRAGQEWDLGLLSLERGASLTGTVETENGSLLTKAARLELRPQRSRAPRDSREETRSGLLAERYPIGEHGFFHIKGVAPGTYVLTAHQEGFAPAVLAPVGIFPNAESEIREPLLLQRPLEFEAVVIPPVDGQGRPWVVKLLSEGLYPGYLDTVEQQQLPESGVFTVGGLAPGRYYLNVSDAEGSRFANEALDISRDSNSTLIELALVEIEGEVVLDGEPLAAELWFGGRYGKLKVKISSNAQGWFEGILPEAGTWQVQVHSEVPKVRRILEDVKVPQPENGQPVLVELLLPKTSIAGTVIDQFGKPIKAQSLITAMNLEHGPSSIVQQRTDQEGEFEFKALEHGAYRLTAEALVEGLSASSEPTSVILSKEREAVQIELVVKESKKVKGFVVSSNGAVVAALVQVRPLAGGRSLTQSWPESVTDAAGKFEVSIPSNSGQLEILVAAAGHELKAFTVFSPFEQQSLRLEVENLGGTLELTRGGSTSLDEGAVLPVVFQNGRVIGPLSLSKWASSNGEPNHDPSRLVVPRMAAGEYFACLLESSELLAMVWALVAPNPDKCRGGYLQPHGRLEIDLSAVQG